MPPRRSPLLSVPKSEQDVVLQEIKLRAELQTRAIARKFDPELGETWAEAHPKILEMQRDINAYGRYVFGFEAADVHRLWNRIADDVIQRRVPQNKVLFIAPPNSAKSTWNSIIRPVHYLGQHPDHSLIFMTSSDPMAQTFGSAIKSALGENAKHQGVFDAPENRPHRSRGWSSDGLYLRGTPAGSKDPAYKAVGFGASIMGARANGIIIDDPLDQKQAESDTEQRRAKSYYDATVTPRLQIDQGWMIAVMTRFHENDFASHLIRLAEESGDWIIIRTPLLAIEGDIDPLGRRPGQILWPDHFSQSWLEQEMRRMTTAQFNLVHQGDPGAMGGDIFKTEDWFKPLPEGFWSDIMPMSQVISVWDLAFSEKDQSCFTVGMTIAVDPTLNMYILHVTRKRMSVPETENEIVETIRLANPAIIALEEDRFHQNLIRAMARNIMERAVCNIQLVRPDTDKISRARLPAGRAEHGMVYIDKRMPGYRAFMSECLGFPHTKFKDQVDTFSLGALVAQKLGEVRQQQQPMKLKYAMG